MKKDINVKITGIIDRGYIALLLKVFPLFNSSLYLFKTISNPLERISIFDWLTFSIITFLLQK